MAAAPNRSRAKRTRFSSIADQLYPEDGPQAAVTEERDENAGGEQDGAPEESGAQPECLREPFVELHGAF